MGEKVEVGKFAINYMAGSFSKDSVPFKKERICFAALTYVSGVA